MSTPALLSAVLPATVDVVERSGADPDEAAAFYESQFDARDVRFAPTGEFRYRYRSVGDDRLRLCTSAVAAHRGGTANPSREHVLAWSVAGPWRVDARSGPVVVAPGVPVMLPAAREVEVESGPGTLQLVRIDADFLEAVAVVGTGRAARPVVFPAQTSPDRVHRLRAVLQRVAARLLDPGTSHAERYALDLATAESVVAAFLPDADHAQPLSAGDRRSALVLAKEFVRQRFDEQLTSTAIAMSAGVSVRTLQQAFLTQDGSTPMRFLHGVRMQKARRALELADRRAESVAAVAHACGFRHMGRFAGDYFAEFGELPSDTIRRSA